MCKDYYAILGVSPTGEDVVIRAAYRAMAQRYHPDRWSLQSSGNVQLSLERMQEINEAYAALCDCAARARYDARRRACASDIQPPRDCAYSHQQAATACMAGLPQLANGYVNASPRECLFRDLCSYDDCTHEDAELARESVHVDLYA